MKTFIYFVLAFALFICPEISRAQGNGPISTSSIGMQVINAAYATNSKYGRGSIANLSGVALNYTHELRNRYHWSLMTLGYFGDSVSLDKSMHSRKLITECNLGLSRVLSGEQSRCKPFVLVGVGAAVYSGKVTSFIPLGGGVRYMFVNNIFTTIDLQYRVNTFSDLKSRAIVGIGIAGGLSTRRKEHRANISVPLVFSEISSDLDGDGITDSLDKCPTVPGFASFGGCPDTTNSSSPGYLSARNLKMDLEEVLNLHALAIQFHFNSHVLDGSSYRPLNDIATILLKYDVVVQIEGHTDSIGTEEDNLALSKRRAETVRTYLLNRGVKDSNMSAAGFGESMPIKSNENEQGRAENRRVVFKIASINE